MNSRANVNILRICFRLGSNKEHRACSCVQRVYSLDQGLTLFKQTSEWLHGLLAVTAVSLVLLAWFASFFFLLSPYHFFLWQEPQAWQVYLEGLCSGSPWTVSSTWFLMTPPLTQPWDHSEIRRHHHRDNWACAGSFAWRGIFWCHLKCNFRWHIFLSKGLNKEIVTYTWNAVLIHSITDVYTWNIHIWRCLWCTVKLKRQLLKRVHVHHVQIHTYLQSVMKLQEHFFVYKDLYPMAWLSLSPTCKLKSKNIGTSEHFIMQVSYLCYCWDLQGPVQELS